MCEDGFESLSMRKLSSRLGMTAANIYNYYTNKDELYLAIQTNGFQILVDRFTEISSSKITPLKKLYAMMRAYVDFGIQNPDYYEIMFSRNTPKYADYRNTPMEPIASIEKKTALQVADITSRTIIEYSMKSKSTISADEALYITLTIWSALHGMVNLYNSRVLQEVIEQADTFIEKILYDLLKRFIGKGLSKPILKAVKD
jgi:AcrR family transcriptional regulator